MYSPKGTSGSPTTTSETPYGGIGSPLATARSGIYIGLFFESAHQGAGEVHHYRPPYNLPALLSLSSLALGDGAIVSVSMRRSFHLRTVPRFLASVSRYRLPCTSLHAWHHHRLGAASRSQVAHLWQVVKARPGVVFQPGRLQRRP